MSEVGRSGFTCKLWLPSCVALEKLRELGEAQVPGEWGQ